VNFIKAHNEYNINLGMRHPIQHKNHNTDPENQKTRKPGGILSHTAVKKQRNLQIIFKETQMRVTFRKRYTIQDVVKPHSQIDNEKVAFTIKMHGLPTKICWTNGPNIFLQISGIYINN
jgi:RecJ-like exonuclease